VVALPRWRATAASGQIDAVAEGGLTRLE